MSARRDVLKRQLELKIDEQRAVDEARSGVLAHITERMAAIHKSAA